MSRLRRDANAQTLKTSLCQPAGVLFVRQRIAIAAIAAGISQRKNDAAAAAAASAADEIKPNNYEQMCRT